MKPMDWTQHSAPAHLSPHAWLRPLIDITDKTTGRDTAAWLPYQRTPIPLISFSTRTARSVMPQTTFIGAHLGGIISHLVSVGQDRRDRLEDHQVFVAFTKHFAEQTLKARTGQSLSGQCYCYFIHSMAMVCATTKPYLFQHTA